MEQHATALYDMNREDQQIEVDANAEAFESLLPALLEKGLEGKYALMHKKKIEVILNDLHDCVIVGDRLFEGKPFSVQCITGVSIKIYGAELHLETMHY